MIKEKFDYVSKPEIDQWKSQCKCITTWIYMKISLLFQQIAIWVASNYVKNSILSFKYSINHVALI